MHLHAAYIASKQHSLQIGPYWNKSSYLILFFIKEKRLGLGGDMATAPARGMANLQTCQIT